MPAKSIKAIQNWTAKHAWWFSDIGAPFLITRFMLVIVGWFSKIIPPTKTLPPRGWHFSPHRLLDIWGRWDTGWYISIIERGYTTDANIFGQGNTAFFPLYPLLVKMIHKSLVPINLRTRGTLLLVGFLVSNLAFLATLTLLYRLIQKRLEDQNTAQKAVLYLCVFPTSFILSAFYTESLFLLTSILAFYAAENDRWWLSGIAGALASLTRATGVLCTVSLGILYWKQKKRFTWDVLALIIIPLSLLGFAALLYGVTGDPLELINSHAGWNHQVVWPWQALLQFSTSNPILGVDQMMLLVFTTLSIVALKIDFAYGIWAIVNTILMLVIKGNPNNMTRYVVVAFPAFIILARLGKRYPKIHQALLVVFTALLGLFMALWSQYYKVI